MNSAQKDGYMTRPFKMTVGTPRQEYTGRMVEKLSIWDNLCEIDIDSQVELVFG